MLWTIIFCLLAEHAARFFLRDFVTLTYNTGAAFGILKNVPGLALILSGVSCAIIIFVCLFANIKKLTRLGLAIMAGGALSNFLERVFLGHVIDWIPVFFLDLHYNLADVEISFGALLVLLSIMKTNSPEKIS